MTTINIVVYGVLARSLIYTHRNHIEKIFKPLDKLNVDYSICYIDNNIENEYIDGLPTNSSYMDIVEGNEYVEIKQKSIDEEIKRYYPDYMNLFTAPNPMLKSKNPFRNSYIETYVANYLLSKNHSQKFVVFVSDCFFGEEIPEDYLFHENNSVICSDVNPARGGYTNGFYIGSAFSISKLISSFYRLRDMQTINYECLLKQNAAHFNLDIEPVNFRFIKIRNNKEHTWGKGDYVYPKVIDIVEKYRNFIIKYHDDEP